VRGDAVSALCAVPQAGQIEHGKVTETWRIGTNNDPGTVGNPVRVAWFSVSIWAPYVSTLSERDAVQYRVFCAGSVLCMWPIP